MLVTLTACSKPAAVPERPADIAPLPTAPTAPATSEAAPSEPPPLLASDLLAMRLDEAQLDDGWVRLFDGWTFFGWQQVGNANWTIANQTIRADQGDAGFLATILPWTDFELQVEFLAAEETNSGVFLRTPLAPEDPAVDCYELNIAPASNPFPTGSLVKRQGIEPLSMEGFDTSQWHTYLVRCEGDQISIHLDGDFLYTYRDEAPIRSGHLALQFNQGPIEFRNILVRPLGWVPLIPAERTAAGTLTGWQSPADMERFFQWNEEGFLQVRGGSGYLESAGSYGDFAVRCTARTNGQNQNSGIFFRCLPGEAMNGYEAQISNDMQDRNPFLPANCGSGGFFRRQDARIIAAENDQWFRMLVVARGSEMAAWVDGLQVSQWRDDRAADPNPRRGQRLEPGTLMIQGHDPETAVDIRQLDVIPLDSRSLQPGAE